jgi:adenine deaminase
MTAREGLIRPGPDEGIYKIAVLERHKGTGNVSAGFVKGFQFNGGAVASTVAHDSHNLVVLGADEASMIRAVELVKRLGGGLAAVYGVDEAVLPLDLAGLMTTGGIEALLASHDMLMELIKKMGFPRDPFPALSFIALPVIPKLKLTDMGLVDVEKFAFTGLFV